MFALPKISCLVVTLNRLPELKQAIRCYCDQTYPNRELVIATDGKPFYKEAILRFIERLGRTDIRLIDIEAGVHKLGGIRNISLHEARGEIICQWDDDDLYGPKRLEVQADYMRQQKAQACFMVDQLQFFFETRELFWIDWGLAPLEKIYTLIPGTMMMIRDLAFQYPEEGEYASAGEDSAFLESLYGQIEIAKLHGQGHLYIYTYHGANTFSETRHRVMPRYYSVNRDFLVQRHTYLLEAIYQHKLPLPLSVKVGDAETYLVFNG